MIFLFQFYAVSLTLLASYNHYLYLTWSPEHRGNTTESLLLTQQQCQTWGQAGVGCLVTLVSLLSWTVVVVWWAVVVRGE